MKSPLFSAVLATTAVVLLVGAANLFALPADRQALAYDGFEGPSLSAQWETIKLPPGTLEMQSSVVRAGKGAAKITLRPGNQIATEKGSELERAELRESEVLLAGEEKSYSYSFSLFVPKDFPIVPTRVVLAQWKQTCLVDSCTPGNPLIAIRYESGELFITQQASEKKQTLYRSRQDVRGRWLDFKFQIRFSRGANGEIKAWLGDEKIIDFKGVNAYSSAGGYGDRFYFKMGIYRDHMPQPMTIYVDEYRKEQLPGSAP